ncbi:hypothetical protein GN244_ATG19689 [Phytophthora infestans]|uniref:Uncharacterized protein n=1 Tax=Phytophthora infestans TaxID=4787 RepID=A0A833RYE7_PHYIN|nr:hypothetical protein GN244_ATG19689 [Phytophthora infestans]
MWVSQVDVLDTHLSDHKGIILHIRSPTNPIRIVKPARAYPVPPYADYLIKAAIAGQLDAYQDWIAEADKPSAIDVAKAWDLTKVRIVIACETAKR